MFIPESLKWPGRHEAGTRWLNRLPLVLDELAERWDPEPSGDPFSSANVAYDEPMLDSRRRTVLPAVRPRAPFTESVHAGGSS